MATRPVVAGMTCAVVLGVLAGTAGCGGDGPTGTGTEGRTGQASASASQRPSRPYRDGHLTFTLLDLRCGLTAVAGSHSEAQPDGQFCSGGCGSTTRTRTSTPTSRRGSAWRA
ncbi:hypothetical protein [Streptomyces longwoodensis]|uniref:hypothetical protein n=1 Tax=Streptomyces longwoodensis TaxID=68231 RepID=UPI0033E71873